MAKSAKANLIHNLSLLPEDCVAYHPETHASVFIKAGVAGVFPSLNQLDARAYNEARNITPAQVNAMIAGSIFGFHVPAANPSHATNTDTRNNPYAL